MKSGLNGERVLDMGTRACRAWYRAGIRDGAARKRLVGRDTGDMMVAWVYRRVGGEGRAHKSDRACGCTECNLVVGVLDLVVDLLLAQATCCAFAC